MLLVVFIFCFVVGRSLFLLLVIFAADVFGRFFGAFCCWLFLLAIAVTHIPVFAGFQQQATTKTPFIYKHRYACIYKYMFFATVPSGVQAMVPEPARPLMGTIVFYQQVIKAVLKDLVA